MCGKVYLYIAFAALACWLSTALALYPAPRNFDAFSGSILVRNDQYNETDREFIQLLGWTAPDRNSPCGHAARMRLHSLVHSAGVYLDEPEHDRIMHHPKGCIRRAYDRTGEPLAHRLIQEGLCFPTEDETDQDILKMHQMAKDQRRGCFHSETDQMVWETTTDMTESDRPSLENRAERPVLSPTWPTGFRTERWVLDPINRPVDFLFLPDGTLIVAENYGIVHTVENRRLRDTPFIDVSLMINTFHDRGLMSIAIPPDYAENPWVYFFLVFEHDTRPAAYEGQKTSRVMKVRIAPNGLHEQVGTRRTILGSLNGSGCAAFGPDSDCIGAEGKSHVGGALTFRSDGTIYVAVGDGAIAIISPVALRSQQFGTYNGKILLIDQEGRGLPTNPWYNGDVNSRDSKMYAFGIRNVFKLHVNPDNEDHVYAGDTQWLTQEEMSVIKRGRNMGWPCWESTLRRHEYQNDAECRRLPDSEHERPVVWWDHGEGTSSSMVGGKIDIPGWPFRYRNVVIYADQARRWIGFLRLNEQDERVQDLERIDILESPVQFKVGPDNSLYWINVRGIGDLARCTYTRDDSPITLDQQFPPPGEAVSAEDGLTISGRFSKTVAEVAGRIQLVNVGGGGVIPAEVSLSFASRTFRVEPSTPLPSNSRFRVVVQGGADGIRDLDGNTQPGNLNWEFQTTGGAVDQTPPTVESVTPASGSTDVPITTPVLVTLSEPLDPSTIAGGVYIRAIGGDRLPFDYTYSAGLGLRITAEFDHGTQYAVVIEGGAGGIRDIAGNLMEENYRVVFTTEENGYTINAEILEPAEGRLVAVGETINFSGRATLSNGDVVPESAFRWEYMILHCVYNDDNECHDHIEYSFRGQMSGSVDALDHLDNFAYQLRLIVDYDGQIGTTERYIGTRKVPFRFESDPPGIQLALNGYSAPAPYQQLVVVGSEVQVFAPETANGLYFDRWDHGGDHVQTVKSEDGDGRTFVARYVENNLDSYLRFASAPRHVPTVGTFVFDMEYSAPFAADVRVNFRQLGPYNHLDGFVVPVRKGKGSVSVVIPRKGKEALRELPHVLNLDLRPRGEHRSKAVAFAKHVVQARPRSEVPSSVSSVTRNRLSAVSIVTPVRRGEPIELRVKYRAAERSNIYASVHDRETGERLHRVIRRVPASRKAAGVLIRVNPREPLPADTRHEIRVQLRTRGNKKDQVLDQLRANI
ncbi:hypothetical protein NDN08_000700 [Rhodosorus marinus]|uniref:Glucose/Sorbosone dehydrogenase domain-containing protein n=1 Tax=Rhodosorus marinus TaxID=101924 RepID=A0AAV8UNV3_9RHOD|nr:hypothetical protein NDN08_000700 [Rhodosorus marinus]